MILIKGTKTWQRKKNIKDALGNKVTKDHLDISNECEIVRRVSDDYDLLYAINKAGCSGYAKAYQFIPE